MLSVGENGRLSFVKQIEAFDINANPHDCNYIFYHHREEHVVLSVFNSLINTSD
jgi:hypothetical protein